MKIEVTMTFTARRASLRTSEPSRYSGIIEVIDPDGLRVAFTDTPESVESIIREQIEDCGIYTFEVEQKS